MHSKGNVSRKAKTTSIMKQREYINNIFWIFRHMIIVCECVVSVNLFIIQISIISNVPCLIKFRNPFSMARVYVGNLDARVTSGELEDEFRVFGVLRRYLLFNFFFITMFAFIMF
jgi:hypothetical protein